MQDSIGTKAVTKHTSLQELSTEMDNTLGRMRRNSSTMKTIISVMTNSGESSEKKLEDGKSRGVLSDVLSLSGDIKAESEKQWDSIYNIKGFFHGERDTACSGDPEPELSEPGNIGDLRYFLSTVKGYIRNGNKVLDNVLRDLYEAPTMEGELKKAYDGESESNGLLADVVSHARDIDSAITKQAELLERLCTAIGVNQRLANNEASVMAG